MKFYTAKELLNLCNQHSCTISEVMLEREKLVFETSDEQIRKRLMKSYQIMKDSVKQALHENHRTMGGLIGGEAQKLQDFLTSNNGLCGPLINKGMMYAMGVLEVNSSMGLIVAAPTAGASGVLPGCLIPLQEEYDYSDDEMFHALLNASAIGYLIMHNANVSGAQGGCQAEVGSASAMAASAICQLLGGSVDQCMCAASFALMNVLGMVCDPIGGLVEVPCFTRNALGVSNAYISAQTALSGIRNRLPLDEMIEVLANVGAQLPAALRETAQGGCAVAPSACMGCVH